MKKVSDNVVTGTVLVKSGISLPDTTRLELSSINGWSVLRGTDNTELEAHIRRSGWHLFYIVPTIVKESHGLTRRSAIEKSLSGAVTKVDEQGLNAVEIMSLDVRRVLGVYIARVMVQPRHIRRDPFISDLKPHRWADWNAEAGEPPIASAKSTFLQAA